MILKQSGKNNKFPDIIETWRLGEKVPSWLSSVCKVGFLVGDEIRLEVKQVGNKDGGYELISSGSYLPIVKTKTSDDYVCFGDGKLFSLSPTQLKLLYKELL